MLRVYTREQLLKARKDAKAGAAVPSLAKTSSVPLDSSANCL